MTNRLSSLKAVFLFLLFSWSGLTASHAQNPAMRGMAGASGRLYGKVVEAASGKGIGYATVQLLGMRPDTSTGAPTPYLVSGQLTRENGDFSLDNIPVQGKYTLRVNYMGFAEMEKPVAFGKGSLDLDLGNIALEPGTQTLKEVVITGEASAFTLALDKKVYRMDKNAVAAGGTGEDALRNVPSLSVDIDGNLSMRNATPQLFVDGRPTTLSLDQIPADAIDNVEVITNPSAKYDASGGGAGIVNIVLKKDRRIGYNGSVRAGIDSRGRPNIGGDINAREGKFNAFLGLNLNQRRSLTEGGTDRLNLFSSPQTAIEQRNNSVSDRTFSSVRTGLDWFIDNRNTLTLSGSWRGGNFGFDDTQAIRTDTLLPTGNRTVLSTRYSDNERFWKNYSGRLQYKHIYPREGREWTGDVDFNRSRNGNDGLFRTTYPTFETRQRNERTGANTFVTVQTDYVDPINASMKIEAGARAAIRDFTSENFNYEYNYGDDEYFRVPGFADRYQFNDQVYAAYATFSHSLRKWGYQAGLRAESSSYTGRLLDSDSTFRNDYPISLFPSLFLTYKVNEEDNLQLNVSRRINRPSFFQLIPFPDFSDSLLLSRGNPNLQPDFTYAVEVSYQNIINPQHNFLVSAFYRRADSLITGYQFREFNEFLGREAVVSSFINSNSSYAYGLEFTMKNTFWKILEITSNINLYNSVVNAGNIEAGLKTEQFTWFLKENLTLRLPKDFTLQLSGEYQSRTAFALDGGGRWGGWGGGPSSTAQGYSIPVWHVDLSVRKDFWDRKGSLSLSMQDVFRSRRSGSRTESIYFVQDTWRLRDPQLVRLNFSYRFGKFDASLFKRKNSGGNDGNGMDMGF